ncbi:calpain-7-like [Amphiura filiformis]|uniref:calpain-7-like n=1 Tax=Amphiura filiformis TaxID=82378 RepID=UPI003B20E16D
MFWSDFNERYGFGSSHSDAEGRPSGAMDFNAAAGASSGSGSDSAPVGSAQGQGGHQADALVKDAVDFATQATRHDSNGQFKTAIFYYVEAIQAMYNASLANPSLNITDRYQQYVKRVKELNQLCQNQASGASSSSASSTSAKSKDQAAIERANFLLRQAFEEDEQGNKTDAIELYLNAAEMCIQGAKSSTNEQKQKLNKLAVQALDRAENLKKKDAKPELKLPDLPSPPKSLPNLSLEDDDETQDKTPPSDNGKSPSGSSSTSASPLDGNVTFGAGGGSGGGGSGGGKYTAEEIAVLRRTSFINGREYVPFISQADLKERFAYPVPFTDKCGKLILAGKQKERLAEWVRPGDYTSEPKMIYAISAFSIRQTIVQDCSFLASLAITANYERRFKKKVITSIVYPQDKKGNPIYNPCGKYMVILRINGVKRKVILDDYLPMDKNNALLCSFSSNRNELWVSILEKAYMKVMGGYDFPGSNSNIDLHALTGWIPERVAIRLESKEFNKDKTFARIKERFHRGDVLVTVATGPLSEQDADRAGLVSTHAYAMLDVREFKGKKLFQLKNPWSHLRWKGRYSENDSENWTPALQKELNFDPKDAQQYDNGVFWIDLDSLCHFFDVIYLNWNPALFPHTYVLHSSWNAAEGPKKDSYNIGNNPQYRLDVKGPGATWILLSRHITDKDDFADNKEFITLLVYKGGKKVFYPNEPPPYIDGTRINSPHYLTKMVIQDKGTTSFTIIISQFEKSNTIHYSLRVFSTSEFKLSKVPEPYTHTKSFTGQWKGKTAGGCANNRETFDNNPIYQVDLKDKSKPNYLLVDLKGPRDYHVGFEIVAVAVEGPGEQVTKLMSGDYRRGFSILQLDRIPGGTYNIRPTTFSAGQEGPFFLTLSASCPIKTAHLQ